MRTHGVDGVCAARDTFAVAHDNSRAIPSWDELELLLIVHRNRSIQRAAAALNVDPSTVRRRVRALELGMRTRLFEGRDDHFAPTQDGRHLLDVAEQMDQSANLLRTEAIDHARELQGVVRISTMEGFAVEYLARRLAQFSNGHPRLRVELITAVRPLSLEDHETDIAVNMTRPKGGSFRLRLVGEFDVRLYAAPEYLQRCGQPSSTEDLASHSFVGYIRELQTVQETRWLAHWAPSANVVFASSSLPAQLQAAIAGVGIAALPAFMAKNHPGLQCLLPGLTGVRSKWWLVTRSEDKPVHRIQLLSDFIAAAMRSDEHVLLR